MPELEFTDTANMLETEARMMSGVIHGAYMCARSFHGVEAPVSAFTLSSPSPITSAQMQKV